MWRVHLQQLKTFVAVAEHGGFRRAARALHYSQPTITAQVRELESSLGVALFERSRSGTTLSPAGHRFMTAALRLLELSEQAAASARCEPIRGTLRIGVLPGGAAELNHPMIAELTRRWPTVALEIVDLPLTAWAPTVPGLDALITRDPVDPDRVRTTELFSEPMVLALPWHWPAREAGTLTISECLDVPLVRPAAAIPQQVSAFWSLEDLRNGTSADYRGFGACDPEDAAEDIASGFGGAFVTPSLVRRFAAGRVGVVTCSDLPTSRVWLTTRGGDRRAIIESLHREVADIRDRLGPLVLPGWLDRSSRPDPSGSRPDRTSPARPAARTCTSAAPGPAASG